MPHLDMILDISLSHTKELTVTCRVDSKSEPLPVEHYKQLQDYWIERLTGDKQS